MLCSIHQPQFAPWLGYLHKIAASDVFVLLDNVQFKKNEYQNRNRIRTNTGWAWLTTPVQFHFGDHINETQLLRSGPWRKKMIHTLHTNYSHAPFFKTYIEGFEAIINADHTTLAELNIAVVKWLCHAFNITTPMYIASEFGDLRNDPTGRLIDLCKQTGATAYLSGQDGPNYMDLSLFEQNKIEIQLQHFTHPAYSQRFCQSDEDFEPYMSALDLLFNVNSETGLQLILNAGSVVTYSGALH